MRFTTELYTTETTHNGGSAMKLSDKQELIKLCLTSFFQNDFYEKEQDKLKRIVSYTKNVDVEFLYKLAKWSRDYGLRTINHIIYVEALRNDKKEGKRQRAIDNIPVRRPDELMDIVGYYAASSGQKLNNLKLSNPLRLAIKDKLESFNGYQLMKYKGSGDVNLYDLINLTRPKGKKIDDFMNGRLEVADTWESNLSAGKDKKETFERLMAEEKLGALATIRNIRNMLDAWVESKKISIYLDSINWKDVFPFQAIQAIDVIITQGLEKEAGGMYEVVMRNVKKSFEHITSTLKGKTAIGIDLSGSMYGTQVSNLSSLDRSKMAAYYGSLLAELTEWDLYLWGSNCEQVPRDMDISAILRRDKWGTYINSLYVAVADKGYDNLVVLTDEQVAHYVMPSPVKNTIVWGLHDYANTIAFHNNTKYFTGYNDIMWKICDGIDDVAKIEKEICNYGKV